MLGWYVPRPPDAGAIVQWFYYMGLFAKNQIFLPGRAVDAPARKML